MSTDMITTSRCYRSSSDRFQSVYECIMWHNKMSSLRWDGFCTKTKERRDSSNNGNLKSTKKKSRRGEKTKVLVVQSRELFYSVFPRRCCKRACKIARENNFISAERSIQALFFCHVKCLVVRLDIKKLFKPTKKNFMTPGESQRLSGKSTQLGIVVWRVLWLCGKYKKR